jgi:hypothetical protein
MPSLSNIQREICLKFGASCLASDDWLKIGISKDFDRTQFPINGLRHPPEGDTTGWYIWSGEGFSEAADFFDALHVIHLKEWCPEIIKYLGMGPGWRFLVAPEYEDVWFDSKLLDI